MLELVSFVPPSSTVSLPALPLLVNIGWLRSSSAPHAMTRGSTKVGIKRRVSAMKKLQLRVSRC